MSNAQPPASLGVLTFGGITITLAAIAWLLIGFLNEASAEPVAGSGYWRAILAVGFLLAAVLVVGGYIYGKR